MTSSIKPLIHIGYPKTATTWLQRRLFRPKYGFTPVLSHVEVQLGIIAPSPFQYLPEFTLARYSANTEKAGNNIPVISSELLAGNIYCGGYNAKQNADRLHQTFPQAKILIVTREQKSLIRALFKTLVQWGMPHSIDRLLSPHEPLRFPQFNLEYFRFELIATYYKSLYGDENVLVIPYELFAQEPGTFLSEIARFAGSTESIESIVESPDKIRRMNTTKPISAIMFQRWFNYVFISNALNYSGMFTSDMNKGAYRVRKRLEFLRLPKFLDERMEAKFHRKVEDETRDKFTQSNRQLQLLCKHDLKALGYEI